MWMHTEIKAIRCVARVILGLGFFLGGGLSIYVNSPVEAATIRSEKWLVWPLIFLGQTSCPGKASCKSSLTVFHKQRVVSHCLILL